MLVIYIAAIVGQGGDSFFEVLPWALLMAIAAVAVFASAHIEDRRTARWIMAFAAILFAVLGFASILTIGIGFLVTSALAAIGAIRKSPAGRIGKPESEHS